MGFVISAIVLLVAYIALAAPAARRPLVVLFDVVPDASLGNAKIAGQLTAFLATNLRTQFHVVLMSADEKEAGRIGQTKQDASCRDLPCHMGLARELGASKALLGHVVDVGRARCAVTLTLYDVEAERPDATGFATDGCDEKALLRSCKEAVRILMQDAVDAEPVGSKPSRPEARVEERERVRESDRGTVTLDGHAPKESGMDLDGTGTHRTHQKLSVRQGLLLVRVEDSNGATLECPIMLDGVPIGLAPWKGTVLARRHEVSVSCAEHRPAVQVVDVASGDRVRVVLVVNGKGDSPPYDVPGSPTRKAWYQKWWPWAILSGAVLAGTGLAVGLTLDKNDGRVEGTGRIDWR